MKSDRETSLQLCVLSDASFWTENGCKNTIMLKQASNICANLFREYCAFAAPIPAPTNALLSEQSFDCLEAGHLAVHRVDEMTA